MSYDGDTLRKIYDHTDGYCHVCGKKLSIRNYACPGRRGAWEVEHSKPRAMGGSDYHNNLYPACISCNRQKGTATTRTARSWYGRTRAPLSKERKKENRIMNTIIGAFAGFLIGTLFGPWGAVIGTSTGAALGHKLDPEAK